MDHVILFALVIENGIYTYMPPVPIKFSGLLNRPFVWTRGSSPVSVYPPNSSPLIKFPLSTSLIRPRGHFSPHLRFAIAAVNPTPTVTMCTLDKRGNIFVLTLTGEGEHRLNPSLIDSIRSALSQAKSQATDGGSYALVTTAHGRFFSNGFDLAWAQSAGTNAGFQERLSHMVSYMKPLVADLISLPMPTIAAVTGHAAAAGLVLALSHDYVLMTKGKTVLYMSELDIGMTFPDYFTVLFGEKLASPAARRDVLLRASKVKAEEALTMRIVDSAHDSAEESAEAAVRLGEQLAKRKWNGQIYGEIRKSLYPQICKQLGLTTKSIVAPRL